MSEAVAGLTNSYASALRGYLEGAGEDALMQAYQVGRSALKEGLGVLQLAAVHQEALVGVLLQMLTAEESQRTARRASEFFLECLAPFEMSQRGVREANDLLEDLNATLGRLVEERTRELEKTLVDLKASQHQVSEHERIEAMKDAFIALVSHELRTPMTSVHGCLDLIRSGQAGAASPEVLNLVEIAFRNSDHLVRLVSDILDMTKIQAGRLEVACGPVDLGELLPRALEANRIFAQRYGVELKLMPVPEEAWVSGNADRLLQVLTNLLGNAAKFSPPGSAVSVVTTFGGDFVRVAVADNGPGIPESFHRSVFERFSQADSPVRPSGGTGLGLSIAKALVEAMGGRIGFASPPEGGAVFHFELPRSDGGRIAGRR